VNDEVELPEMPEPDVDLCDGFGWAYSDDRMTEYARAAVLAERARCIAIAEATYVDADSERGQVAREIAAAIRKAQP
jgi:hypothetical protein